MEESSQSQGSGVRSEQSIHTCIDNMHGSLAKTLNCSFLEFLRLAVTHQIDSPYRKEKGIVGINGTDMEKAGSCYLE